MDGEYTTLGLIVGAIVWICLMGFQISNFQCVKIGGCNASDLFLAVLIGFGMLPPAWFIARMVSSARKRKDK